VAVVPAPPEDELPEAEARRVDLYWSAGMVGAIGLLFLALSLFRGVGVPVALALAVAYGLNPIVTRLAKRGVPRAAGAAGAFAVALFVVVAFLWYVVPLFRDEAAKLPAFFTRASAELLPKVERIIGLSLPGQLHQRTAEIGAEASKLVESVGPAAGKLLATFAGNTARVVARILGLLVVPVLAFFFLKDYPHLVSRARALLPRRAAGQVSRRFAEVDGVLSAFVRGQLTVGSILSVLYCSGLSIARIDMAILIGLITGFGNMVPYLGTAVGLTLAMLSLVISWQGPWQLAVIVGTFVVAQASEGLVITPRIVGERVGLPPVAVIIAVLAFGELFGFVGVLLAVPTSATLKVILKVLIHRYKRSEAFLGGGEAG
jgi:predicted PurR-regulated permease PerM